MIAKGTVKGNIVVLDEGESLPDGARVEIGVIEMKLPLEERRKREEIFNRILSHQINRYVGMNELLREERQELEERYDRWRGINEDSAS